MADADHHVVVVGGGFGGVQAIRGLSDAPVRITLVDRRNFTLFQPLTYQIATGALSPGDVAYPFRALFRHQRNVQILLAEVTSCDLEARRVSLAYGPDAVVAGEPESLAYDTLIVATGSSYSYFGHDEFRRYAHEVKTLESAIVVRSQILEAFERAELGTDPATREADLTFVIVGAGPTGVEMAGQIGELARRTLVGGFRRIDPRTARVVLIDGGDRILQAFPPSLSARAVSDLSALGVTVIVERMVTDVDGDGVTLRASDGTESRIASHTVVWAAGVTASSLAGDLARQSGAEVDSSGRVTVEPNLTLAGHPEVIALGDMVCIRDRHGDVHTLPGVAPAAIQMGRYAARLVTRRLQGERIRPFHYFDKGNVATIGRGKAVVDLYVMRLSGFLAWMVWLVIHIFYLIGFRNRFLVIAQWAMSYVTGGRGAALIEDHVAEAAARGDPSAAGAQAVGDSHR